MDNNLCFFDNYYYNIINNIFNILGENNNILLVIKNDFNIFDHFSHIIKKKNINIDILIENIDIYNKIVEDVKGEECENNIKLYSTIEDISNNKIYNVISIFHLDSTQNFENILNKVSNLLNKNTLIYVYSSLSNKEYKNISYQNYCRKIINQYTNLNIGNILKLSDIILLIDTLNYNIVSLKTYKKNNYLLYGDNTVYQIIINKN